MATRHSHRSSCTCVLMIVWALMGNPNGILATEALAVGTGSQELLQGQHDYQEGAFSEAIGHLDQAVLALSSPFSQDEYSRAIGYLAESYGQLGQLDKNLALLRKALAEDSSQSPAPTLQQAKWHLKIGNLLTRLGRFDEAESEIRYGLTLAEQFGDPESVVLGWTFLGECLAFHKRPLSAQDAFQHAISRLDSTLDPRIELRIQIDLFQWYLATDHWSEAAALVDKLLTSVQNASHSFENVLTLTTLGEGLRKLSRNIPEPEKWRAISRSVLAQARNLNQKISWTRGDSLISGYLGRLYEEEQQLPEALQLTQAALFKAQSEQDIELLFLWQRQSGRLLRQLGKPEEALWALREAVHHLESMRWEWMNTPSFDPQDFQERSEGVHRDLVDLLLRKAETPSTETEPLLKEARLLLEQIKAAELQDYFQDDCVTTARAKGRHDVQSFPGVAILYPVLLPDRAVMLVGLPSGMKQIVLSATPGEINQTAEEFRVLLENRTSRAYLRKAWKLHKWVIAPLAPLLSQENIHTLVIISEGALRQIPLAALHDGQKHLVEQYAIVTVPSLDLTDTTPLNPNYQDAMLGGLTKGVQGFPPLPHVDDEMYRIAQIHPGKQLKDQEFSLKNLEQELEKMPYPIVHLASHGQFEGEARNSFILTYDTKLTMNMLDHLVRRLDKGEQPVEMLVLSACQTAQGDDRAALGLAGIAIKAGARSALASLWFVNDQASALLVTAFYEELSKSGTTKAEALQRAQHRFIQEDRRYRHPAYWAPFLLIGDWL